MCDIYNYFKEEMAKAMTYLYRTAQIRYPTLSPWHDDLVEEVLLKPYFVRLRQAHVNKIPPHVDGIPYYRHMGALLAYKPAQLAALLPWLPWKVELGETPLVFLLYDPEASN